MFGQSHSVKFPENFDIYPIFIIKRRNCSNREKKVVEVERLKL